MFPRATCHPGEIREFRVLLFCSRAAVDPHRRPLDVCGDDFNFAPELEPPQVSPSGRGSGSCSSFKERRKSLTPVIIALSPPGHIRSAPRLTDPAGKSFTRRSLRQAPRERSFYLPASIPQTSQLSKCTLGSCSAVLSARRKIILLSCPSLEECHQRSFEDRIIGPPPSPLSLGPPSGGVLLLVYLS